jgi:hypothetical protein
MTEVTAHAQASDTQSARPVRPLEVLSPLIRENIRKIDEEAAKASFPHYAAAGAKLWEAKAHFGDNPHAFYEWATRTFDCSRATIRNWMTYAVGMYGEQIKTRIYPEGGR